MNNITNFQFLSIFHVFGREGKIKVFVVVRIADFSIAFKTTRIDSFIFLSLRVRNLRRERSPCLRITLTVRSSRTKELAKWKKLKNRCNRTKNFLNHNALLQLEDLYKIKCRRFNDGLRRVRVYTDSWWLWACDLCRILAKSQKWVLLIQGMIILSSTKYK